MSTHTATTIMMMVVLDEAEFWPSEVAVVLVPVVGLSVVGLSVVK